MGCAPSTGNMGADGKITITPRKALSAQAAKIRKEMNVGGKEDKY